MRKRKSSGSRRPAGRKVTFIVHDSYLNQAHCCQTITHEWNLRLAFEKYLDRVLPIEFDIGQEKARSRFSLIGAIKGLVAFMADEEQLRAPTVRELREALHDSSVCS